MSAVLRYLKKKIKPFRKCMISSTKSFEMTHSNLKINQLSELASTSEPKSSSKKRKFKLRLKRNAKSNLNEIIIDAGAKVEKEKRLSLDSKLKEEKRTSRTSISSNEIVRLQIDNAENSNISLDAEQKVLYNTPNTSNTSDPYAFISSFTKTELNSCNQTNKLANFMVSSVDGEFLNSTSLGQSSSGYADYASASHYDADRFSRESFVNSTPAGSNMSATSMVTYNTKYAKSNLSDDDGLMSVGESQSSLSIASSNNMQQSTPYNENFARVRSLKARKSVGKEIAVFKKSNTVNFDMLREEVETLAEKKASNESIAETCRKKCRRSNTTYTILGSKSNSKVIEYFSKLEMSKPIKKKANIRKLNNATQTMENSVESKLSKNNLLNSSIESLSKADKVVGKNETNGNEVEKIQDVLFYDDSSLMNPSASFNGNNLSYMDSPTSSIKSFMRSPLANKVKPASENKAAAQQVVANALSEQKKLNETHLVDCSMEKMRRSLSMPGFNDHVRVFYFLFELEMLYLFLYVQNRFQYYSD